MNSIKNRHRIIKKGGDFKNARQIKRGRAEGSISALAFI